MNVLSISKWFYLYDSWTKLLYVLLNFNLNSDHWSSNLSCSNKWTDFLGNLLFALVNATIQTISQLYDIYGTHKTNTITSQFNTKFFFKNSDKLVAQLLSDEFGETEKVETTESLSYGAHEMRDGVNVGSIKRDKKIITPDMLSGLKALECFVSMPSSIKVKMKLKV